jgi:hypothetical protein
VEVFGVDSFTELSVVPSGISFSLFEGGAPTTAPVGLNANAAVAWTSASDAWASVLPGSGTAPQTVNIEVDPAGLQAGSHTSHVRFITPNGTASVLRVSLEVKPSLASLSVAPSGISFKYQQGSMDYPSRDIILASTGSSLSWAASASVPWLSLGSASGTTPSTLSVALNSGIDSLTPNTYSGKVTIDAGSAKGSPAEVTVSARVIYAGTVKVNSNLEEAGFRIDGPAGYTGSGTSWSHAEVVPGTYTISFDHVSGYLRPHTRSFTVETGHEAAIEGIYRAKPVAAHIVAGSGSSKHREVAVLAPDGTSKVSSFVPPFDFSSSEGVRVYPADLDGDGIDEVMVKSKDNRIIAYTYNGSEAASLALPSYYNDVELAAGDLDHDGSEEVVVGFYDPQSFVGEDPVRTIKVFGCPAGTFEETGVLNEEIGQVSSVFSLALGDIDADGRLELLIADKDSLRALDISESLETSELWALPLALKDAPRLAAGDLDGDGVDKIALSAESGGGLKGDEGLITILDGNGNDYNISINPFGDLGYRGASSVAFGDIDGDGMDEILAGAGIDSHNAPLIRVFESNGDRGPDIMPMEGKDGINVGLGRFK